MSSTPDSDLAAEDLLVRARRNELTANERRKLRMLLESSKELELLYLAGVELDRSSALVPDDEARMQRLVELGRARISGEGAPRPRKRRGSARSIAAALGVGALLGASVSAAFQYGSRYFSESTPVAPSAPQATPVVVKPSPAPPRARATASAGAEVTERAAAPPPTAAFEPVSPPPRAAAKAVNAGAAALFAQASQARRDGDGESAIRLYEQLCAQYPGTVEAADARVSLGKLKLQQHSAQEALQHFESYPPGTLSAEALWGRAEALKQMSSPAERAALERIVREYPDSPYAMAARKRLETRR
jgi:TolA-binding protein